MAYFLFVLQHTFQTITALGSYFAYCAYILKRQNSVFFFEFHPKNVIETITVKGSQYNTNTVIECHSSHVYNVILLHWTLRSCSFKLRLLYPNPSDLGSQASSGEVSSTVREHVRSPRDERFCQLFLLLFLFLFRLLLFYFWLHAHIQANAHRTMTCFFIF
jgi:hypothetical protein